MWLTHSTFVVALSGASLTRGFIMPSADSASQKNRPQIEQMASWYARKNIMLGLKHLFQRDKL